jgi:hypothetical protein
MTMQVVKTNACIANTLAIEGFLHAWEHRAAVLSRAGGQLTLALEVAIDVELLWGPHLGRGASGVDHPSGGRSAGRRSVGTAGSRLSLQVMPESGALTLGFELRPVQNTGCVPEEHCRRLGLFRVPWGARRTDESFRRQIIAVVHAPSSATVRTRQIGHVRGVLSCAQFVDCPNACDRG